MNIRLIRKPVTACRPSTGNGWLGLPTGDQYQMIAANANPELIPAEGFEVPSANWIFDTPGGSGAGTFTRETTGGAVGNGAGHYQITAQGFVNGLPDSPSVRTYSSAQATMTSNQEYSVTFWAKADHFRPIQIAISATGGRSSMPIPITTDWKQYQVVLKPTYSSSPGHTIVQFYLADELGDVWLDDIHVQAGVTNVFRRNFQFGTVLVNPYDNPQTVTLEKSYQKIHGTVSPTVNDGSIVSQVTLAGANSGGGIGDGIFLTDFDLVAPAAVTNLSAGS